MLIGAKTKKFLREKHTILYTVRKIWTITMDTGEFDADFKVNDLKNCMLPFAFEFSYRPCFFTLIEKICNVFFAENT